PRPRNISTRAGSSPAAIAAWRRCAATWRSPSSRPWARARRWRAKNSAEPASRPEESMIRLLIACLVAAALGTGAGAQSFPDKTIRIIVPFTPGGANDVVAREIASGLQARFKEPAVVENKPGGGGTIGYSFVAKSPPDGHTLLIAPASFTMSPHLSRNP